MKVILRWLVIAIVFLLGYKWPETALSLEAQDQTINKQTSSILLIKNEIQNDIKNKILKKKRKSVDYCQGNISEKEIYQDSNGKIRKYRQSGGSDDSAVTEEYFYDEKGKLKLIVYDCGSVRGESILQEIFFNQRDKVIRVNYERNFENKELNVHKYEKKVLKEPVETFGSIDYVWDPLKEFRKKFECND
jgi:hypothetical protein